MTRSRTAVAVALLGAALAAAGCGLGGGDKVGGVELTVTRDYGAERIVGPLHDEISESATVMRVLDRNAEISTRFGGAFVQAIDGIEEGREGGRPYAWFFYVNGLWAPVGAGDYPLRDGEAIWWDYRDWSVGTRVSAVVGSWPHPFADGYEGSHHPTAVRCLGGGGVCVEVRERLRDAGASLTGGSTPGAIRVLVGPWGRLRGDRDAALLEQGTGVSGVFAGFARSGGGFVLLGLDEGGDAVRRFGPSAGLVAAMRRFDAPPAWIVTGATAAGVRAAAKLLDAAHLRDRYALATELGEETPLPVGS